MTVICTLTVTLLLIQLLCQMYALKDIQNIENALDKVCQISGYTFTYTENDKESAGVLAQEIEQIYLQR